MIVTVPWLPIFSGLTLHPRLILVRKGVAESLLAHEQVHAAQMLRSGWLRFWFRYLLSREYRLACEAEAYAISVSHGVDIDDCADFLSKNYWLCVSPEEARHAIEQYLQPK
jgi:hypothetical protein